MSGIDTARQSSSAASAQHTPKRSFRGGFVRAGRGGTASAQGVQASRTSQKRGMGSRFGVWLSASVFDYVLVLIAATALTLTVSYGFNSAPDLRGNIAVCGGIAALMLLILFAGSWSKRALVPAALGALVYGVGVIALLVYLSPSASPLFYSGAINDSEDSYFVFGIVAVVVPVLVYLLSRRRVGTIVLLISGVLACEVIQFLYRDWASVGGTVIFVVALISLIALFVYQGYRASVYAAARLKKTSFGAATVLAVVLSAVCVLLGVAVFAGLISGLGLETPELKPFKDYFTRPVIEYSGNYTRQPVDNPDETTSLLSDTVGTTNQNTEGGNQTQSTEESEQDSTENSILTGMQTIFDNTDWDEVFQAINYRQLALTLALIVLGVIALIIAVVLLWRYRRRWRIKKLAEKPCAYKVWYVYEFLLGRFKRVGFKRIETLTPMEFALAYRGAMLPYSAGCDADFLDVTLAYQRAVYDEGRVSPADYELVERYYWAFYKNAHKQCSWYKWAFWRFWRL